MAKSKTSSFYSIRIAVCGSGSEATYNHAGIKHPGNGIYEAGLSQLGLRH